MGLNLIHKNVDVHQHGKADDPDIGEVDHQHPLVDDDMFHGPYLDKKESQWNPPQFYIFLDSLFLRF